MDGSFSLQDLERIHGLVDWEEHVRVDTVETKAEATKSGRLKKSHSGINFGKVLLICYVLILLRMRKQLIMSKSELNSAKIASAS